MLSSEHQDTVTQIVTAYRDMKFMQKQRIRSGNAMAAYVRRLCGFSTDLSDDERKVVIARAKALVDAAKTKKKPAKKTAKKAAKVVSIAPQDAGLVDRVESQVDATDDAIIPISSMEKELVKQMERLVESLPIWTEWAKDIPGLGKKGVAIIIGEAGDIGSYRSEGALWKRMGVGVLNGIAQGKLGEAASKDDWIAHGYNKQRRSALFTIGAAFMKQSGLRTNKETGEKEIVGTPSMYRTIYLNRKEYERQKFEKDGFKIMPADDINEDNKDTSISMGHIDRRAQRYMEKKLLRHMYQAWRRTMAKPVELAMAA